MDETSLAIDATGLSASGYVFTDTDLDGFAEAYTNDSTIFSTVQVRLGEEFSLEVTLNSLLFHDSTSPNPAPGDERLGHDFADTFRFALVLPEGVTFEPVPEPNTAWLLAAGLLALGGAVRRSA